MHLYHARIGFKVLYLSCTYSMFKVCV